MNNCMLCDGAGYISYNSSDGVCGETCPNCLPGSIPLATMKIYDTPSYETRLRDEFAINMAILLRNHHPEVEFSRIMKEAYFAADAAMQARKQGGE